MELNNGIIKVTIAEVGAEIKSVVKGDREYMWCGDPKYWCRTSPVLFPFVGGLKNGKYTLDGVEYDGRKHGFARDAKFDIAEQTDTSVAFSLKDSEETYRDYPYHFELLIKYTLDGATVKVEWTVKNENDREMGFSIGGHPAFNLCEDGNYFKFNTENDIKYYLVDPDGLCDKSKLHTAECNGGYLEMYEGMFDNDAFIIEGKQATEVSLCNKDKEPYVSVKFDAPLFGLWHPAGTGIPFVCIEPWYGRCDGSDFAGDLFERDYVEKLAPKSEFNAGYEMKFI